MAKALHSLQFLTSENSHQREYIKVENVAWSLTTHPLLLFRDFTPERSLMYIDNVANPLAVLQTLLHSREFILERRLRDVWSFLCPGPAVRTY